jgi:hypothetical protein
MWPSPPEARSSHSGCADMPKAAIVLGGSLLAAMVGVHPAVAAQVSTQTADAEEGRWYSLEGALTFSRRLRGVNYFCRQK